MAQPIHAIDNAKPSDRTEKVYGAWKIPEHEYRRARVIAYAGGCGAADAYQLVRYCDGSIFYRDAAERAVKAIRAERLAEGRSA